MKILPQLRVSTGRAAVCVAVAALIAPLSALSQDRAPILIVSHRADGTPKGSFINLGPHIEPAMREAGKLDPLVFRADLPALRALVDAKTLSESDLKLPLSRTAAHKIAQALGARYIVTVSASATKEGISANAETEANLTLDQWTTLSNDRMVPGKMKGRQLSLLESVHALVSGLVEKVQGAIARGPMPLGSRPGVPRVSDDVTLKERATAKPTGSGQGHGTTGTTSSTGGPSRAANEGATSTVPVRGTPNPVVTAAPPKPANGPSTYELLIDKARRNGDTANLLIGLRRAVTEKPHDIRLRRDLIKAYADRGWSDLAREEASRAVSLAPTDPGIHRLLGDALMSTGEADAALKEFKAAVQLAPKDSASYVSLGDAYASLGKPDESLRAYEDAAKADPKSAAPARRLARLYGLNGRYADCIAAINTAKSLTPTDDLSSFREDQAALLTGIESILNEVLARLAAAKRSFVSGTKNRETTHNDVTALRKKAEEIAGFLDQLPDVGFNRVQALYEQGATLIGQTAEKYLDYLETENTSEDEEASLMRVEAAKQIGDAARAMKALVVAKK